MVEGTSWQSSPYDIAKTISQGLADATVIAKVNNQLWDLDRPLEGDCTLQLIKFDDPEGQAVFWHSSAHVLGEAMEHIYGGHLCYGPPIENGFYYDMYHEGEGVSHFRMMIFAIFCDQLTNDSTIPHASRFPLTITQSSKRRQSKSSRRSNRSSGWR